RQRHPLALDEDRLGLLARRRRAVRVHGDRPADAGAARPRRALPALRLPQRHARAPERLEREGPRRALAADLRRRRAFRDPPAQGDPGDLVAPVQGLLVADVAEVRDSGLSPAGLLLRLRAVFAAVRPRARDLPDRDQGGGLCGDGRRGGADRAAASVRAALYVVRDVVRHGVEQGPALVRQHSQFDEDFDRAIALAPPDPAELEEAVRESRSESAGDMELPLAPVEAAADDRSSLRLELREIDSKRLAATLRSRSDCVVPVAANDDALPLQSRAKLDAEAAGEM